MKPNTPITMYDEAGWEVQVQPTIPTKPNNIPMAGRTVQATNPIATGPVTVTLPVPDPQDLIETFLTPYDQGAGETRYLTMVNGAKNKIRMCAFGFTDPQVSAALVAAQARHVDIGIVMDENQAGGPHQMIEIAKLKATNIPLWIGHSASHDQLVHAKFTVVDDLWVEDGSWNYSPSASHQDNFLNFMQSPKRAKLFNDYWEKIKAKIIEQQTAKAAKSAKVKE